MDYFSSLLKFCADSALVCALIYRAPHYNKMFLQEFSELLSSLVPFYDKLLILGDFNIHVCCPSHPLINKFLQIIDSFNLVLSVSKPMHDKVHLLDLVISLGLSVTSLQIDDFCLSDHKPVLLTLFSTEILYPVVAKFIL